MKTINNTQYYHCEEENGYITHQTPANLVENECDFKNGCMFIEGTYAVLDVDKKIKKVLN